MPRIVALKRVNAKSFGGNYDRKLFAKLRKSCVKLSLMKNIPPYVVFNDAHSDEMAEQMRFIAKMLACWEFGMRKHRRFGRIRSAHRAHVDGDDEGSSQPKQVRGW